MQSTHGWIRTTINAINSRALYRLSYMGIASLSRVDSNPSAELTAEATISGFKDRRCYRLNYDSVQGEGFEPPTSRFRAERSTGLNYP